MRVRVTFLAARCPVLNVGYNKVKVFVGRLSRLVIGDRANIGMSIIC